MLHNILLITIMTLAVNNSTYLTDIRKDTRKHCHDSAFMAAIHILVCLTQVDYKSYQEIAADFDNNLELIVVWVDYMTKLNWVYKNKTDDKWVATEAGKRQIAAYIKHHVA
jgi:hypothetical protein